MKSVLYVGATLMIGASIYGFVDYKKTSRDKEFTNMYEEQKTTEPIPAVNAGKTEPSVKKEVTIAAKKLVKKKLPVQKEETTMPVKPITDAEKMTGKENKVIEKTAVTVTPSKDSGVEKKIARQKTRKFSTKLFSRGALDERYTKPKIKKAESKEDSKKTENKEQ